MLYFLINPTSSRGRCIRTWKHIEKELKNERVIYQLIISKSFDDVSNIARDLTSDKEVKDIVILGGDGTLNAFLNGMVSSNYIRIGYLPFGSGNDFARGMDITSNYKEELQLILHDKRLRHIHYGNIDYSSGRKHRFFVSCGIGYDARVCYEAEHSTMKSILNMIHMGRLIYLYMGVKHLLNAKTFSGRITIDEDEVLNDSDILFGSVHMLPYEGGGFKFCPDARPETDSLHMCVAAGIAKKRIPFIIPQAFVGTHIYHKGVYQFKGSEIRISVDAPQYVHTDGETDHLYEDISISISDDTVIFLN